MKKNSCNTVFLFTATLDTSPQTALNTQLQFIKVWLYFENLQFHHPVLAVLTYEQYPEQLYLLLNSTHSLYNFSRADLVFVRIFISTHSKSLTSDDNWRDNLTSHDGRYPFPDWNKKCTKKYCESFQLLVIYPVTYSTSTVRLMIPSCLSVCLPLWNNFWNNAALI